MSRNIASHSAVEIHGRRILLAADAGPVLVSESDALSARFGAALLRPPVGVSPPRRIACFAGSRAAPPLVSRGEDQERCGFLISPSWNEGEWRG